MDKKVLFEIPIYSMTEKEFNKRWTKKKNDVYNEYVRVNDENRARMLSRRMIVPKDVWKYNQIIGYIVISVSKDDIWIDLYKETQRERYHAIRDQKHYIRNVCLNGMHFRTERLDDEDIHKEIRNMLKEIEHSHLKHTMYVDYSTFENVFDYLNIKQIMNS